MEFETKCNSPSLSDPPRKMLAQLKLVMEEEFNARNVSTLNLPFGQCRDKAGHLEHRANPKPFDSMPRNEII
jgi:hypothetical protein